MAEFQHISWDDVELETVNPHMQRRIVTGERLTVARIYFKDGFLVPLHSHEHEQVTQVISGSMRFRIGANRERTVKLGPGDVIVIPSNVPHEALSIGDVEEMDTWSPRRDDWLNKTDDYLRKS
ncbi:MAG: cupin domain-containing protein [Gammaproteobacteria bacterium]|nr:cupin domain-containing protein [Gammaproteobacteria bacterium]MDH4314131.1 cupin domain-containing protein [Gammaproteobacteria bacterium]MDH5212771.1 cupin domain-containing protein [Gammaproteobacteria bacterium]MDH5500227.1 cupin domain-containing protein [Gammaproteobacteria bacterium]